MISHASDIVISSSNSSLQVKEQNEPVKTTRVPVRKSTLSSGEVRNPLLSHIIPSISTEYPLIFISSTKILLLRE